MRHRIRGANLSESDCAATQVMKKLNLYNSLLGAGAYASRSSLLLFAMHGSAR